MTARFNGMRLIESFGDAGNVNAFYGYGTNDTKNDVEGAGYFNVFKKILKKGDIIAVAGDVDGTPFHTSYVVSSNDGTTVVITEHSSVTQNSLHVLTVTIPALGTDTDHYIISPVAGAVTAIQAVSNGANGTAPSTIDLVIDAGDKATLTFADDYSAGTMVEDDTVTANTLSAGEVIKLENNGEGDGTGEVVVTLVITPS